MPTIKDVARAAGVSVATVSYVLNNKPSSVSDGTRRKVQQAIEQLGYTRNITAQNLRANETRLIGYALIRSSDQHTNSVLEHFNYHLAQAASLAGYHLLTFTYDETDPTAAYDELIRTGRVDAFVISHTRQDDPRIHHFMDKKVPFVSFGRSNPDWDFNWVDTDGRAGVYSATRYLIEIGHRNIMMVGWPENSLAGNDRLHGYLDALAEAQIPVHPDYIFHGEYSDDIGQRVFDHLAWLPRSEKPSAIVAVSDMTAINIMGEAERRGHQVGRTLSVIGFDDETLSQYLRPALTTLRQPIVEISAMIVEILLDILSGNAQETRQILMEPQLILRDSVSPLVNG